MSSREENHIVSYYQVISYIHDAGTLTYDSFSFKFVSYTFCIKKEKSLRPTQIQSGHHMKHKRWLRTLNPEVHDTHSKLTKRH
jgi:hypothetical protein